MQQSLEQATTFTASQFKTVKRTQKVELGTTIEKMDSKQLLKTLTVKSVDFEWMLREMAESPTFTLNIFQKG